MSESAYRDFVGHSDEAAPPKKGEVTVYLYNEDGGGTFGIGPTENDALNIACREWVTNFGDREPVKKRVVNH